MPWLLALALGLTLLTACNRPQVLDPDNLDLDATGVARGFARDLLDRPDLEQALRWTEASAGLEVRSQVGFLAGAEEVEYSVGIPTKEDNRWRVTLSIRRLRVEQEVYRGRLNLELTQDARRVVHSSLTLTRADGLELSL